MKHLLYFVSVLLLLSSKETFSQEIEWQRLHGIEGSYITAITQTQSGAIFVATPYGVWRTLDTLRSWANVSSGLKDSLIYGMAATGDGGLLVSTYHGVYRSSDDGNRWSTVTPAGGIKYWQYIYAHKSGNCFAGARKRLYRSTNHGKTWSSFADSIIGVYNTDFTSNLMVPVGAIGADNRILVGRYYSDNNGKTWKRHPKANIGAKTLIQCDSNRFVLGTCYGNSITITTNSGTIWHGGSGDFYEIEKEQNSSLSEQRAQFAGNLSHFTRQHLSACYGYFLNENELLLSIFGGGVVKIVLEFSTDVNLYPGFAVKSKKDVTDYGLATRYPTCIFKFNDSTFLLGSYGAGLFISKNKGDNWLPVKTFPNESPIITTFYNDDKRGIMYAGTMDGLYSSEDRGENWLRIDSAFYRPHINAITVTSKGTLIATSFNRCFRKELGKRTWEKIETLSNNVWSVLQLSSTNDSVFAVKGQLMVSMDDGKTFIKGATNNFYHDYGWGGGNYMLSYSKIKSSLVSYGTYGLNKTTKGLSGWGKRLEGGTFNPEYKDPFDGGYPTQCVKAYLSRFDNTLNLTEGFILMNYDWSSNVITTRDKPGEWLYGEWIFGLMSDQKGRPFAATMNGIAFSEKADKKWEYTSAIPGLSIPAMKEVEVDDKGYIYAGSVFGGVYRSKNPIAVLSAPELIVPDHKAMEVPLNSSFKWSAVKDAKTYYLQIAEDSLFASIVYQDSMTSVTMYGFTNIKENSRYYWRVQSRLYGITSPWSETRTFNTITVYPSVVLLREPAKGSQNRNTTLNLIWNLSTQTESYHIQVAEENTFGNTLINDSTLTSIEKKVENLEGGTEYFWRVRGKNKAGYGTWSEIWNFRTKGGINSIGNKEENQIYFYITNNEIIINNNPYREEATQITLSDITGRIVFEGVLPQGTESTHIEIPTITSGYYTLSITNPHTKIHKGLLHIH